MQTAAISDEDIATQAHTSKLARTIAFGTGALLALAALGIGRYKDEVFQEQVDRLQDLISRANLEVIGQPTFAGFDPPSTLPWLRRTEIWVEVA